MLNEWKKFRGWIVLEFFLKNPYSIIHIKGLARELKVSPRTVEIYFREYEKSDLLIEERVANICQFFLNNDNPISQELKKIWFLLVLQETNFIDDFINKNPYISTLALYGGYSSGEFSEDSDIDLLIITQQRKLDLKSIQIIEKTFNKHVEVVALTIGKWREMVKKEDKFSLSVLKNNVVLFGAKI